MGVGQRDQLIIQPPDDADQVPEQKDAWSGGVLRKLKQVLYLAIQGLGDFQGQDRGGHINPVLNGIDALSGHIRAFRELSLRELSCLSQRLEVV